MKQIIEKVRIEATRVIRAAENIKQQVKAQGQEIEDSIIMNSFALPHFLQAFQELEAAIYEDNDIDEQELEEAVNFYIDHYNKSVENQEDSPKKTNKVVINHSITKELIEITKRIRIIYKEFGGDIDEDGNAISNNGESKDYSLEEAIELMKSLSTKMLDSTDSFAEDFKENYGVPSTMDEMNQFQEGLLAITER